ncbi:copper resistance CopC family protein [Kytococcus sedentarius]|uniref:copper resistance CopC family protein n=1 Tax=Kytococcus sedentarius TaxID=1276 RepID=UPI00194FB5BB|nr:copper resistance CopC family protein [Kytococcus sedentarius]QRO87769.1 copper resistance protein CopC [Kytococcus sedentarius]
MTTHHSARARRTRTLAAVGAATLTCTFAAPAGAHDVLEGAEPSAGETLTEAPDELVLTYSDAVQQVGNRVSVTDSAGEVVAEGEPTADGPVVTFDLPEDLADGSYTTTWRVVSSDGHPISGTTDFTVAAGSDDAGSSPAQSSEPAESSGAPSESSEPAGSPSSEPTAAPSDSASAEPTESTTTEATGTPSDEAGSDAQDSDQDSSGGLSTTGWVGLGALALVLLAGGALLLRR